MNLVYPMFALFALTLAVGMRLGYLLVPPEVDNVLNPIGCGDAMTAALAWAYVVTRCIHAAIHLGPNVVLRRFQVFVVSLLILASLWAALFVGYVTR